MRGIGRSIAHSSTLTIVHTAIRPPSGSLSGLRSTIAEYGTRSGSRTRFAYPGNSVAVSSGLIPAPCASAWSKLSSIFTSFGSIRKSWYRP